MPLVPSPSAPDVPPAPWFRSYVRRLVYPGLFLLVAGLVVIIALWRHRNGNSYFQVPLDRSLQLAAYFGELRENHFHMGIDIRTDGKEGLPVYAAADGYIGHLSVHPDGLGNALFIIHRNGLTTVYGHLSRFTDPMQQYLLQQQQKKESWEMDLDAPPERFPVKKGDLIAYSGNTGASRAPHLHFEVRDTRTGKNINPLLEGFDVTDNIPPNINSLYWYDRRTSTYTTRAQKIAIKKKGGNYSTTENIVQVNSPLVSLGMNATDKSDGSPHISGIFAASLWMDDSLLLSFRMQNLLPGDTRYINACIDYTKWIRSGIYVQHLSVLPGNHAPIFSPSGKDGLIRLSDTRVHRIHIKVSDVNGNSSDLTTQIRYSPSGAGSSTPEFSAADDRVPSSYTRHTSYLSTTESLVSNTSAPSPARLLLPGREERLITSFARVTFSPATFYDRVPAILQKEEEHAAASGSVRGSAGSLKGSAASVKVRLLSTEIPLHQRYLVQLRSFLRTNDPLRNRTIIYLVSGDSQYIVKGKWQDDWMEGAFDRPGILQLRIDTSSPTCDPYGWQDGQTLASDIPALSISAKDDLGAIDTFRGELDGHWIPFACKGNLFTTAFNSHCPSGSHHLDITITDVAGNRTHRSFRFLLK